MSEREAINQSVVILFILMAIFTGALIVEHSRFAIIPLIITFITGVYVLMKMSQRTKCNCE